MQTILIQLDTDAHPSVFDRVIAVDAGAEHVFSYGGVTPDQVQGLVHGAIFTRGPRQLRNTAIFLGGSDVQAGETLLRQVEASFFGPMRVSVMMDSNGSNTTAAAAVLAAAESLQLDGCRAVVLGGTGPVGQRVAQLLAMSGSTVGVVSRSVDRAQAVCNRIEQLLPNAPSSLPVAGDGSEALVQACAHAQLIVAAGASGVEFLTCEQWQGLEHLKVAIDLNAVPPTGLGGIEVGDRKVDRAGVVCYGAIGVGATKKKIHFAALQRLFEANDLVLDTEAIYRIGAQLVAAS
jgi:hypothetical protein